MKRRQAMAGLLLLGACFCGCETLRQGNGQKSEKSARADDDDEPTTGSVRSKPQAGFFQNSRLSGGLSSEARDIERDFGIQ